VGAQGDYVPLGVPLSGRDVAECVDECSGEAQAEVDVMCSMLQDGVKGRMFGRMAALEVLGRLVQYGLIGPGPLDGAWLERVGCSYE